jgi:hypothetical protein
VKCIRKIYFVTLLLYFIYVNIIIIKDGGSVYAQPIGRTKCEITLVSGVKENYTREGEIGSNVRHIEVINQGEYTYLCLHFIYIYV